MKDCCQITEDYTDRQRRVLSIVLLINVAMFVVEFGAGLIAHSTSLLADSFDMIGDAIVYGFSLYVVARGSVWQARGALLKGLPTKIVTGAVPVAETMGAIGALALAANVACLALLWPRRADDVNMRSVWACSLNDVAGNIGVLAAGAGVAFTRQAWPDIIVGLVIAGLFAGSAVRVIRDARRHLRPVAAR